MTDPTNGPSPPASILLVDDSPANLLALRAVLEGLGHDLVEARSGEEALLKLAQGDFAVVLLDVRLPGLGGFATAQQIRGRERTRHTPIIFVTAYESDEFPATEGYQLGAVDYLVKPLVPKALRAKVTGFVELFQEKERARRQAELLRRREDELRQLHRDLEKRVQERTADLAASNEALREESQIAETLHRIGSTLAAELDLRRLVQCVTDEATRITDAAFGAFFYNVADQRGESYTLYTISGVPRDTFERFPMPRNTTLFEPTFRGQGVVRLADVTRDPRYGHNPPYHGMPPGHLPVRSYLAAPVVSRSGEVLGGLFFGHPQVGVFSERDERLVVGIAAQAAVALDNARLYQQARDVGEELRRRNEELATASRHKDEFLSMLAHELRNPLAPVRNGLEILKSPRADRETLETVRAMMERQVGHLTRLVDDLLDVSRITRGTVQLRRELVDLARLARVTLEDHRGALAGAGLTAAADVPELPVWVEGDPTRLAQVLGNLLHNAVKFTPRGGSVSVRVSAERGGGQAVLAVRDTGVGIEPGVLPRVFEAFAQGDRSLERSKGGLGLGLALVKGMVGLHGGTVHAASAGPGRGAEFVVRLPLQPEPAALTGLPRSAGRAAQSLRVLVVEDHRDAAESLRMLLELYGYDVTVAETGPAGVETAKRWRPDVVLCDIGLPGMDGFGVARELRRDPATARARLIAVTGYGGEEDRRKAAASGFDAHLTKPADPVALADLLARSGATG